MSKIKLFCFPFAGGSAAVFNPWRTLLDKNIELCNIELAGRGRRIREPLYNSIPDAVADVFDKIKEDLNKAPYALLGHSMGSVIAFELYYKIKENNLPGPVHIFFSGRGAAHMPTDHKKKYHLMPEDQFKEEMIALGGTAKEFFQVPDLMEVFLPILKGDLKVNESYAYHDKPARLECDITVLNGEKDPEVTAQEVAEWKIHTGGTCTIHTFPGDHFFINDEGLKITEIINNTLAPLF